MFRRRAARKRHEFAAGAVAYVRETDLDAEMLVLAEFADGSGQTIEVQRSLGLVTDGELYDEDYGMHCVVIDAGPTHYGGVASWSVDDNTVRLVFTDSGAATLGATEVRVRLEDPTIAPRVAGALSHLLDDADPPAEFRALRQPSPRP